MSDWDFLHDMHNEGYSPKQIADAAACGYNPWEWVPIPEKEMPAVSPQDDPELVMIFESSPNKRLGWALPKASSAACFLRPLKLHVRS